MSNCVWYVSKYVSLPSAGKGGIRAFMLMREMVRAGHRAVIITSNSSHVTNPPKVDGAYKIEHVDGIEICWVRTRQYEGAKSLSRIISWLDFEYRLWRLPKHIFPRPDAVIVSSLSLLTILNGISLKRRFRCRLIFEIRDIWPLTIIEEGGFNPRNPFVMLLGLVEQLGYRRADAIVGTMPNLKQHVDEQVAEHGPVHCVPFGIDPDMIENNDPVPTEWLEKNVPKDKFIVCYAGTIGIANAMDPLFECARAMKDDPRVQFLIVGEGDLTPHYRGMCADLPNVTFTGPVAKPMVQSVLDHSDVLYFSSHVSKVWKYGLSLNKIIDYMLAAKPVIGNYTGYRTMIDEAQSGSIVPAGDARALQAEILRYAAMPIEERAAIGARGRAWLLKNWPYKKLASDYLEIALPAQKAAPVEGLKIGQ